jgi:hypothetical protein
MSGGTTLALAFGAVALAGLLLSSGLRNRSLGELLRGITSPNPEQLGEALGGGEAQAATGAAAGTGATAGHLTGSKRSFASALQQATGLDPRVIAAWMNHEQGSSTVEGGNNWLNVETGLAGGGEGPHSGSAREMERKSPQAAAQATAAWLRKNQPGILAARGHGTAAEVNAITHSGFAGSHYGYESAQTFLAAA